MAQINLDNKIDIPIEELKKAKLTPLPDSRFGHAPELLKDKTLNKKGDYERAFERYIDSVSKSVADIKPKFIGKLYQEKDIKSAVEWLKLVIKEDWYNENKRISITTVNKRIDEAFEDMIK